MPEATLKALAAHEGLGEASPVDADGMLAQFARVGIVTAAVAAQLLREGIESFGKSWSDLMTCIASKSEAVKTA
jgi:transaldolase